MILLPILGISIMYLYSNFISEIKLNKLNIFNKLKNINNNIYNYISLIISLLIFIISIIIYLNIELNINELQYYYSYIIPYSNNISLKLGIDGINIYFILLTTFIFPITILCDWNNNNININNSFKYYSLLLIIEFFLLLVFLVQDILLFYIFFEALLPPLFLLIGTYGSSNKIKASYYLILYTLFGSLFLLLGIIILIFITNTTDLILLKNYNIDINLQYIIFILIFIAFAIKTPLVPFHIWLNLAHSEAPLSGSIILASIILKLALYGFLKILLPITPLATIYFTPLVYVISIITIIWASVTTLRQIDLKRIIAYSSIAHVSVSILGLFSNNIIGLSGSILLGLAHGLVSPALFIIVGGIIYNRYHNRNILYYKGLITYYPLLSILFLLFSFANCGIPLTINFLGELFSFIGTFENNFITSTIGSISIVLSAAYSIWLWSRMSTGIFSTLLNNYYDINRLEFNILLPILFFTFFIGLFPNFIIKDLEYSLSSLII